MKSRCKICRQPATRKRGLASLCDAIECEAELGRPAPVKRKIARPMKSKGPKSTPIRQSARGEECTLLIPHVCNHNSETVVWAHSNFHEHGKGMGLKAKDEFGCYACSSCHAVLDGQAPRPAGVSKYDIESYFYQAMYRSRIILRNKGLLKEEE